MNLTLEPGEICHVRGPNGSGKSSLLLTLAGSLPPVEGEVSWNDAPLPADGVALAGHLDGLKPALTLRENLDFWSSVLGAAGGSVSQALATLRIEHCADVPAVRCSAGERRRAALARVFLTGRPIWLLDEPGATLDPAGRSILRRLLSDHVRAGGYALVATHDALPPEPSRVIDLSAFALANVGGEEWFR